MIRAIRAALLPWPGRVETPRLVKQRLLLVATVMAISLSGMHSVMSTEAAAPFSNPELRNMSGLPQPPVRFAPVGRSADGRIRQLTKEEFRQLEDIRRLIDRFPVPDAFVNAERPKRGG